MANYTNLNDLFTDMADAIRGKKDSTDAIVADDFPEEIESIRTGFDYNNIDVTELPDYAFYACEDLNNVNCINLTSIGENAFENCTRFKTIILFDCVTSVGENAFKGCFNLTIYCAAESKPDGWHENWNPDNCEVVWGFAPVETWDISATKDDNVIAKLYKDLVNEKTYSLIISGSGEMKHFTYSDTLWKSLNSDVMIANIYNGVTSIGSYAFYNSGLTSIIIPDSVTSIGASAFAGCDSLTSAVIPDGVTSIGGGAFGYCDRLTSITIPDSVASIGDYVCRGCTQLTSIAIPDGVTSIGKAAFQNCSSLTSIAIPNSVTSIGGQAFQDCSSLTSITIPNSVTSIGGHAFYNSGLASIDYTGTIAQWQTITLGEYWAYDTPKYTIHCTDGDITKDGTITYH